jgi:hypothetical protein
MLGRAAEIHVAFTCAGEREPEKAEVEREREKERKRRERERERERGKERESGREKESGWRWRRRWWKGLKFSKGARKRVDNLTVSSVVADLTTSSSFEKLLKKLDVSIVHLKYNTLNV